MCSSDLRCTGTAGGSAGTDRASAGWSGAGGGFEIGDALLACRPEDILKEKRAEYGQKIVSALGTQLSTEFGRGFGVRNLFCMVRFADVFPDSRAASIQASVRRSMSRHQQHLHWNIELEVCDSVPEGGRRSTLHLHRLEVPSTLWP